MARVDAPELVILVAEDGTPVGTAPKAEVHTRRTPLHLAFSCHILNDDGDVLITRRSLAKQTWPGVWTNSVCGHPAPGEPVEDAVRRRARLELGMDVTEVTLVVPDFRYRAVDASGIVEHEICPVFTARTLDEPRPDPHEVMEYAWVTPETLRRAIDAAPWALSPWLVAAAPAIPMLADGTRRRG